MKPTRSEKKQATRTKILKAAYALFNEKGYDETSYGEIAERAGVGYGTIYTHFSSKENLLLEFNLDMINWQADRLRKLVPLSSNPLQRALDMIDLVWNDNFTMPIRKLTVFFSYRWVSSKEDYERILTGLNNVLSIINASFEEAQAKHMLSKRVKLPLATGLIRTAYLHALQSARFGEVERADAKNKLDEQVDYLLQIERPLVD